MSLAPRIFSTLLLLSLVPAGAHADCGAEDYYAETVVEPAKIEYGKRKINVVRTAPVTRGRVHPAVTKRMTLEAFQNLPKMMSYQRKTVSPAVYGKKPIAYVVGDISDFDFVEYPNGQIVRRPLKNSILEDHASAKVDYLISPERVDLVEETVIRPEPVELPDGQLQVMIMPRHNIILPPPSSLVDIDVTYIKNRTPARIKLTPCHEK